MSTSFSSGMVRPTENNILKSFEESQSPPLRKPKYFKKNIEKNDTGSNSPTRAVTS